MPYSFEVSADTRYWLSVQANIEYTPINWWFWLNQQVTFDYPYVWRNIGDGFGTGCITWTIGSTCLPDSGHGLSFRMFGSTTQQVNKILNESFENGLSAGWSIIDNQLTEAVWRLDDPGNRGNLTGGSGSFAIADSNYYGNMDIDTELRTLLMDMSGVTNIFLYFRTDFDSSIP